MDSTFIARLLELYPSYSRVYGPYKRDDDRYHIILNHASGKDGQKTISWPKAILEVKLGRRLVGDETTDHIDEDFTNDSPDNLQVLTRNENSEKPFITGSRDRNFLAEFGRTPVERQRRSTQMKGDRNLNSQLSDDSATHLLRFYAGQRVSAKSRKQLCLQYGCSDRTLRNLFNGVSYRHLAPMVELVDIGDS